MFDAIASDEVGFARSFLRWAREEMRGKVEKGPDGRLRFLLPKPGYWETLPENLANMEPIVLALMDLEEAVKEFRYAPAGYVYLLKAGPWTKIGKTRDLESRIGRLAIQLPFPVELAHAIECAAPDYVEKVLHSWFSRYRLNGEWFELPDEVVLALKKVPRVRCKGLGDGSIRLPGEFRSVVEAIGPRLP